jgi:hypothetical protein
MMAINSGKIANLILSIEQITSFTLTPTTYTRFENSKASMSASKSRSHLR